MIRIIRKYQRGVLGIFAILFIGLAMAGFGLDLLRSGPQSQAIKINDTKISYDEYYRELSAARQQYQRMFGANFEQLAKSLNLNLPQEVIDRMIADELIKSEAQAIGLAVGDEELRKFIKSNFGDVQGYAAYLRSTGENSAQFEARIRTDLLKSQYGSLLTDVSFSSKREAETLAKEEETKFSVKHLSFVPKDFESKVTQRSDDDLKKYFEENSSDFQTPPAVMYEYVVFDPESFAKDVVLGDEDIALYLSENEEKFKGPERVKARKIELLYPKSNKPELMAKVKTEAEEVLVKATSGEPFESLVLTFSDDIPSKAVGGDMGWVARGTQAKEFDEAVFKLKAPGIAELISTDTGFQIVKVEEYEAPRVKELAEVRGEIEAILRKIEAPAYAAIKAQELYSQWKKSGTSLAEFAQQNQLAIQKSSTAFDENQDPSPALVGLTKQVLEASDQKQQIIEIGDRNILLGITEYRESTLPAFDAVRDTISQKFKEQDARAKAFETAQELIAELKGGKPLAVLATEKKLSPKEEADFSKKAGAPAALSNPQLQSEIFSTSTAPKVIEKPYEIDGNAVVVVVDKVTPPSSEEIAAKVAEYQKQETQRIQRSLYTAVINQLKNRKETEIDFDRNLLAAQ